MSYKKYRKELPVDLSQPRDIRVKGLRGRFLVEAKEDGEKIILGLGGEMYGKRKDWRGVFVNKWNELPFDFGHEIAKQKQEVFAECGAEWIEAELTVDGGEASDVKTALIKKSDKLRITAFNIADVPTVTPETQRELLQDCGFLIPHYYGRINFTADEKANQAQLDEYLNEARRENREGLVLWQRRKYPDVYRAKLVDTLDVICTGFEIGTAGQWKGKVASICFSWYVPSGMTMGRCGPSIRYGKLQEIGKCSGMNNEARLALSDKDIGRPFEIVCNGFAKHGRTRHARFKRWRDDKSPEDCIASRAWWQKFTDFETSYRL